MGAPYMNAVSRNYLKFAIFFERRSSHGAVSRNDMQRRWFNVLILLCGYHQ